MHKPKGREGAASPGPSYMDSQQMASYLSNLRNNRVARPNGTRPPPTHFGTWSSRTTPKLVDSPIASPLTGTTFEDAIVQADAAPPPAPTPKTHSRTTSNMSIDEVLAGRALVQPPRGRDMSTSTATRERTPSVQYRENGRRQTERDEARALRIAMEELDLKSEEGLYNAARDEAAELVWNHRNSIGPGANPDAPYPYPGTDSKGSHQRTRSLGRDGEQDLQRSNSKLRKRHSMGSSPGGSRSSSLQSQRVASGSSVTATTDFTTSQARTSKVPGAASEGPATLSKKPMFPDADQRRRSSSGRRRISASLFKNPADQIYEEPEEETPIAPIVKNPPPPAKMPLQARRNPFSRFQNARDSHLVRANTDPTAGVVKRFDRYEIQNNPPTQSRNAAYTSNAAVSKANEEVKCDTENEPEVKLKDGREIRGDDIRAATSMRLKDRSAKLPTPTMVSDSPGRPIVSFQNDWKPREVELKEEISLPQSAPRPLSRGAFGPRPLSKSSTAPAVPTVHTLEESPQKAVTPSPAPGPAPVPQISVSPMPPPATRANRTQVPAISIYEDPPAPAGRPLPSASASRKVNTPSQNITSPVPTIVSQTPPARFKPDPTPTIPTIAVQEAPSISISAPTDRSARVSPPSISVTPSIPTISVNEPSAPSRGSSFKTPSISVTPSIPTISVNEPSTTSRAPKINAPSISVTPSVPTINVSESGGSTRPLPNPKHHTSPFARNSTASSNSSRHWTPTNVRTGALCAQCALPISGRIVSAAGSRFHPECFLCHHCGEHLECVAFYPEPDNKRAERIDRIQARIRGEDIAWPAGPNLPAIPTASDIQKLEIDDGDESARFYCHLDFHELFSPRCKSCKTPIEGEVVVACGAEWHVGHFFCAQCGDPFDSSTPFVEKEGYAWCVDCHTNRYSTKCKKCRRAVTDTVVKALGAEWHVGCFCCMECSGPFDDGRYFLRGDSSDPVCVRCEERRLKA